MPGDTRVAYAGGMRRFARRRQVDSTVGDSVYVRVARHCLEIRRTTGSSYGTTYNASWKAAVWTIYQSPQLGKTSRVGRVMLTHGNDKTYLPDPGLIKHCGSEYVIGHRRHALTSPALPR